METTKKILWIVLLLIPFILQAEVKEIPFTLDDRDRIIRTEQKVEALNAKIDGVKGQMDSKFDTFRLEMNARFDQLFNFLWAIIGIFTTMMVSVFGFAFWDRRLSLVPMKKDNTQMLNILRDFAEQQPKLREILKNAGLL